jgi:uncharacterized protein YcfJ
VRQIPTPPDLLLIALALAGSLACVARAQDRGGSNDRATSDSGTIVLQPENVRMDFAQVMRVQPIYQVLRATRMEPKCKDQKEDDEEGTSVSKIVGAVKGAFAGKPDPAPAEGECEMVPVVREFRRPIAYDVDYVYRGTKYRSRLPYDPGNKLRVRVSVVPYVPPRKP